MFFNRSNNALQLRQMELAQTYEKWSTAASAFDHAEGNDDWKEFEPTESYDYRSIRNQLDKVRDLRYRRDHQQLLYTLNEGLHGNIGGIGKPELYNKAKFGTKRLIHQYIDEICHALNDINESDEKGMPLEVKREFFSRASHCYGRSALLLGGGGSMGYFHAGVVKALFEQGLLPEVISGSSVGSLIGAIACTHSDADLSERLRSDNLLFELKNSSQLIPKVTLFDTSRNIDVGNLTAYLEKVIPDLTFQEAFELTGRKLNVTVSGLSPKQAPRLLSAITAPNVCIRSAVQASCAIYGIFPPVTLQAKDSHGAKVPYLPSQQWIDGSFLDDLPVKRLSRLYGVNHFIGSIINPAFLLSGFTPDASPSVWRSSMLSYARLIKQASSEVLKLSRDHFRVKSPLSNMGMHLTYSLLSQEHTADLNISPKRRLGNPMKLLSAPNPTELEELVREGESCAWERIEMIRNCTSISRTLDNILYERNWET